MQTTFIIVLSLLLIVIWRRYHHKYSAMKYRYKIFAVRDKLRLLAAKGEIDPRSKIFNYFDETFAITINQNYYITLFSLAFMSRMSSSEVKENEDIVNMECEKNIHLKLIRDEFIKATSEYIVQQHLVTAYCLLMPILIVIRKVDYFTSKLTRWSTKMLYYPETSDVKHLNSC